MVDILNFLKKIETRAEEISDWISDAFGKPLFILLHFIWWGLWIGAGVEEYPYGVLTLTVSFEAIVLSALILNSSNRAAREDQRQMKQEYLLNQDTNTVVDRLWDEIQDVKTLIRNDEFDEDPWSNT